MCKVLAIIPARGGSQRIPEKNIKEFCGQPMISWPLSVLKDSSIAHDIIVSTDSREIAKIAEKYGATVPFMRPDSLSDNFSSTAPVIKHAVEWYLEHVGAIDYVLTVYPTAVFLSKADLENALHMLKSSDDCEIVFSGTRFPFPIQRAVYLDDEHRVSMFTPEYYEARSQDLVEAYHDAGQFYFSTLASVQNDIPVFSTHSRMLVLPRYNIVDIDTLEDFEVAQRIFKIAKTQT